MKDIHGRVPAKVVNGMTSLRIECPKCFRKYAEFSMTPGTIYQSDLGMFSGLMPCHGEIAVVPDDDDPFEKVTRLLTGGEYDSGYRVSYSMIFGPNGEILGLTAILEDGPRAV